MKAALAYSEGIEENVQLELLHALQPEFLFHRMGGSIGLFTVSLSVPCNLGPSPPPPRCPRVFPCHRNDGLRLKETINMKQHRSHES